MRWSTTSGIGRCRTGRPSQYGGDLHDFGEKALKGKEVAFTEWVNQLMSMFGRPFHPRSVADVSRIR